LFWLKAVTAWQAALQLAPPALPLCMLLMMHLATRWRYIAALLLLLGPR
jgi:hypothetical protein